MKRPKGFSSNYKDGTRVLGDLKNKRLIYLKAVLLVLIVISACLHLVLKASSAAEVVILFVAIWASCRLYYFAFYVLRHYVDPEHKVSGLLSFVSFLLRTKRTRAGTRESESNASTPQGS